MKVLTVNSPSQYAETHPSHTHTHTHTEWKNKGATTVAGQSDRQTITKARCGTRSWPTQSPCPRQMSLYQSRLPLHCSSAWITEQLTAIIYLMTNGRKMTFIQVRTRRFQQLSLLCRHTFHVSIIDIVSIRGLLQIWTLFQPHQAMHNVPTVTDRQDTNKSHSHSVFHRTTLITPYHTRNVTHEGPQWTLRYNHRPLINLHWHIAVWLASSIVEANHIQGLQSIYTDYVINNQ